MARWEIRLANQEPVRVEVDDARNLVDEYEAFDAWYHARHWWFSRQRSPFWRITDEVVIHRDLIAGIVPKPLKPGRLAIGFEREGRL